MPASQFARRSEQLRRIAKGKWHIGREKKRGKGLVMLPVFEEWDRKCVQGDLEFGEALDNMVRE